MKTERMLLAAKDQVLRTNDIKSKVDKQNTSLQCRLGGERQEIISHEVTECKMLAQKQCRLWGYDRVGVVLIG